MWPLKKRQPHHVDAPRPLQDEGKKIAPPLKGRESDLDRMLKEIALVSQEAARRRKVDPAPPVDRPSE